MKLARVIVLATLLGAVGFWGSTASAGNWPQWRGPDGSGISNEKNLPLEWSPTKNIKWKTPIEGRSHSSPIVWGNRVFLTTAIEGPVVPGAKAVKHMDGDREFLHPDSVGADHKHTFKVLCLDRDTGKILWEATAWEGTPYDNHHRKGSYAASTPTTDGKLVYAFFGTEGLYAYDFKGKLAWKVQLGNLGTVGMGTGTSPILFEDLVIVQCDEENGASSFIVALDKKTGKEVWKIPRKVQVSWATPILVRAATRTELITSGTEFVISYDPATGKELWRHKGVESNAIPSPVADRDMVFISAGFPAKIALAIRLGGSGDLTGTPNVPWKYEKGTAYVPSPIVYGDYLYLMTDRGILTCIDAKTGEIKYEGGRIPIPATFTASPVAFDGKILLTSEDGDTFVVKAGPKHEILGTNSVGEPVYASPAIADGRIFIRGEKNLYSIGN
ncbi:MAG TPA: PQQ-binding-like beta-propeller repeat protein [Pyrinomonadaceae bacterium]|jgi:outer membrane protein assembly factor BamB|nr:PQQ-binding-like beta-propeller repeat protein [Pyrinomonadaceae bacterium]